jgi:hypothetical protein
MAKIVLGLGGGQGCLDQGAAGGIGHAAGLQQRRGGGGVTAAIHALNGHRPHAFFAQLGTHAEVLRKAVHGPVAQSLVAQQPLELAALRQQLLDQLFNLLVAGERDDLGERRCCGSLLPARLGQDCAAHLA